MDRLSRTASRCMENIAGKAKLVIEEQELAMQLQDQVIEDLNEENKMLKNKIKKLERGLKNNQDKGYQKAKDALKSLRSRN